MPVATCYVCEEVLDTPVRRVCRCDTRIHDHCFAKLVDEVPSHHDSCPVGGIRYRTVHACHPRWRTLFLLHLSINCFWFLLLVVYCLTTRRLAVEVVAALLCAVTWSSHTSLKVRRRLLVTSIGSATMQERTLMIANS